MVPHSLISLLSGGLSPLIIFIGAGTRLVGITYLALSTVGVTQGSIDVADSFET